MFEFIAYRYGNHIVASAVRETIPPSYQHKQTHMSQFLGRYMTSIDLQILREMNRGGQIIYKYQF